MKRWFWGVLLILFLVNMTGCDALQKKFTRKKKAAVKPRFYQIKKYPMKPSPERYKQHYSYWSTWQGELIQVIGQNSKKDKRCIEEAVGHLKDMQSLLVDAKAEELEPHIEKMEAARSVILKGDLTYANRDDIRRTLEREWRGIARDFCYARVKDSLIPSSDGEAAPKAQMAPGKEVSVAPTK